MSMSDCKHCWQTPCCCGWDYRNIPIEQLEKLINVLSCVVDYRKGNPGAVFSTRCGETPTHDDNMIMHTVHINSKG